MKKIICFHPAIAPYRIDFFNAMAKRFDQHLVLLSKNLLNQKFDQESLVSKLKCRLSYLLSGIVIGGRHIKYGFGRFIKAEKPDIVFGFEFGWTVLAVWAYRTFMRGTFKVYTMTDDNEEQLRACRGLRKLLRNWVLRHIDGVIVTNDSSKKYLLELAPKLDIGVVPIIYDNATIRENEEVVFESAVKWRRENLKEDECAAFFIGRLAEVKNLMWLVDRVEEDRWPEKVKLFIIGDGPLKESLEKRLNGSERLGSRMTLLGRKEGFALQTFFAAEDFLILPSLSETFGAVVSESLHWGARCLVSSHVGAKDLVREVSGGEVFNGVDDFFENLNRLLSCEWNDNRPSLIEMGVSQHIERLNFR